MTYAEESETGLCPFGLHVTHVKEGRPTSCASYKFRSDRVDEVIYASAHYSGMESIIPDVPGVPVSDPMQLEFLRDHVRNLCNLRSTRYVLH